MSASQSQSQQQHSKKPRPTLTIDVTHPPTEKQPFHLTKDGTFKV